MLGKKLNEKDFDIEKEKKFRRVVNGDEVSRRVSDSKMHKNEPKKFSCQEILEMIKKYHALREERMKAKIPVFSGDGNRLDFKSKENHWRNPHHSNFVGEWFKPEKNIKKDTEIGLKRSEKSKFNEIKRNMKQIELEEERKRKVELKRRLVGAHKVKNVLKIKGSAISTKEEEEFERVQFPISMKMVSPTSEKCFVKIKMLDSTTEKVQFQNEFRLHKILDYAIRKYRETDEQYEKGLSLQTMFPRKKYTLEEIKKLNIKKANLVNGTVNIVKDLNGYKLDDELDFKDYIKYEEVLMPKWRLKSQPIEEKERYEKKVEEQRKLERKKQRKKQKEELKRIRKEIELDKFKRQNKYRKNKK